MRLHRIASEKILDLGYSSKLNAKWAFPSRLRNEGRRCAGLFLEQHVEDLGQRATFDLNYLLEGV
jgi:NTE family protein